MDGLAALGANAEADLDFLGKRWGSSGPGIGNRPDGSGMAGEMLAGPALQGGAIDGAKFLGRRLGMAGRSRGTHKGAGGDRHDPAAIGAFAAGRRGRRVHLQTTTARAEEADVAVIGNPCGRHNRLDADAHASAAPRANDPLGRIVVRHVAGAGVDVSTVVIDPAARTGVYFKDPRADETLIYYYRSDSAASQLDASALDHPRLAGARMLHLSGITPALSARCRALVRRAVLDRPLGATQVIFDVNYRPALWADDAAPVLRELANAADLVFVGLDEAQTLWGLTDPSAIRRLLPDPEVVVVKDGSVGASAFARDGEAVFEPAPLVRVVEPVGAGDAFAAGYLSASLRGGDLRTRIRMGHLVAAHALSVMSDHAPLPDHAWFDERTAASAELWSALEFGALHPVGG